MWASLALDFLPIMATSVSSERAFSQGGITISKRRNRLKGDIVEALQCLKCAIQRDLLFREPDPSLAQEDNSVEEASEAVLASQDDAPDNTKDSWDVILDDSDDDIYDDEVDSDTIISYD